MVGEKTDVSNNVQRRMAILIDGDNAQSKIIENIIREVERYGVITIRRIYGDWTLQSMNSWKANLHDHAIQPIQQFQNTVGKNATDSAMIIDAMDILHNNLVDGFAIVSSDSDYTRLAMRIREQGYFVMGIGEKKTPQAFVKGCNVFVYTENLKIDALKSEDTKPKPLPKRAVNEQLKKILIDAFNMSVKEDGWAYLADVGNSLLKIDPGFDVRTYQYKQLIHLIKDYSSIFEIKEVVGASKTKTVSVRMKE